MGAGKTVGKGIELVETFLKELNKPAKAAVKAAPQDEALRLAQLRAALPPAQGGLGLPANNTPMQRAAAMRRDTGAYHGSKQDITGAFKPGYDDNLAFVTKSPAFANNWIGKGKNQKRLGSAAEKEIKEAEDVERKIKYDTMDYDSLNNLEGNEFHKEYDQRFDLTKEALKKELGIRSDQIHNTVYPLTVEANKTFNPETDMDVMLEFFEKNGVPQANRDLYAGGHYMMYETKPVVEYLKGKGYDSMRLRESTGDDYPTIAVFNPESVRSRFAAHDPFRKDAATAAVFGVAAPDLMAKEQEKAMGGDVHMMGGGRPPKKTTLEEDLKSFKDPAIALADMLAGAARGTTATATGFYGDIEDLVRKYGKGLPANVIRALLPTREGKETLLPTVEEMDAMLPPVVPKGASRSTQVADIANTLGMANPLAPAAGELGVRAVKAAAPYIARGALDLAASRPMQEAVEQLGALTGAGPMYAVKRERQTLHPRGKPLGKQAIREMAERMAPQVQGQFVRAPGETKNVEGKTIEQFTNEQSMPMVVEDNTTIPTPKEFSPGRYKGNVAIGVPGDPTLGGVLKTEEVGPTTGTRQLRQVGNVVLDEPVQLFGGTEYGLGNPNNAFWASNLGAAKRVQNIVNDLGEEYPILGKYIKMGPGSENFAQHSLDSLLSIMQPHNLSPEKREALAQMIRKGFPGQSFETFSGFDNPKQVMLEAGNDSELRKFIAKTLKQPDKMKPFEMPDGRYVATAITHPDLRNIETGASGHAVGRMVPGAELPLGPHPTYSNDIPGQFIGRTRHPYPLELAFPDTYQYTTEVLKNRPAGTQHFGLFKMLGPRQMIDDQYANEINDYLHHMKRLTGKKEGGEVHMSTAGAVGKALEKTTPVVNKAIKDAAEALRGYIDPIATKIAEWNWRPMSDVRQDVPDTEVPEYIQKGYGNFMAEQAKRAAAGDLNARDLIKAYTITRSSVNRGGLGYNTATKTGMQLPRTQGLVRPEGAFSEWLGSPAGQRYLDDAVLGKFDEKDLEDMVTRFAPFGMPAVLADDMRYAARSLSPKGASISADVLASPEQYRETSQQLKGIGPAKSGFMASLLGRGDYPTFDARQIRLHTGQGGKDAAKYMTRGKGVGGEEAVARLADRQRAMNMSIDPSLDPFYQHLVHHTVWDKIGNEQTTHDDLVKAMRGYADGGDVKADFFIDPSSYAQSKSKEMYPTKKSEWTERDAARHMLASGMMAQKFGPTVAKMAGMAHEHFNAPVKTLGYALGIGKMPADYEQDLHNNALGIDLAKRAATQEELERLIKESTGKASKTQTAGTAWIGEPKNAARLSDY
jgi:hypothetical protein